MKVLIVNRYMSIYGGAEQVVRELSLRLTNKGIDNLILALNISPEVAEKMPWAKIVTPEIDFAYALRSASLVSSLGIFKEVYHLRRLVKKYYKDFDVINVHNFPANWVAYGLNKPVVWMCNEVADFYNNPNPSLLVKSLRAAGIAVDRYLVNDSIDSICVADRLNARTVALRYKRDAFIIPYGIEARPQTLRPEEERDRLCEKYPLSRDDFIILQVGLVSPTKNQKDTVEALIKVKDDIPNARLILAGSDKNPYARSLKEYIKDKGVEGKVVFTGLIPKDEVYELYSICNLCAFPVKLQGGYLSVFEALSFAVPVIVSPRMGAAGIVADHDLGVVSDDLESYIKDIHRKYSWYKERSEEADRWVRDNLTWENFSDKLTDIFEKALKK